MNGQTMRALQEWLRDNLSPHAAPARRAIRQQVAEEASLRASRDQSAARAWGIQTCDHCGRTILLGETTARFERDSKLMVVCPTCADELLAEGYRRAA
jgi:RNase P subunit RPR2